MVEHVVENKKFSYSIALGYVIVQTPGVELGHQNGITGANFDLIFNFNIKLLLLQVLFLSFSFFVFLWYDNM